MKKWGEKFYQLSRNHVSEIFRGEPPPPQNKRTAQFATLSSNNNNHQDKHLGGMDA